MATDASTVRSHGTRDRTASMEAAPVMLRLPSVDERPHIDLPPQPPDGAATTGPHYDTQAAASAESTGGTLHVDLSASSPEAASSPHPLSRLADWFEGGGGTIALWIVIGLLTLALAAWVQVRTPAPEPDLPSPPSAPASAQQLPRIEPPQQSRTADNPKARTGHTAVPRITGMRPDPTPPAARTAHNPVIRRPVEDSSLTQRMERAIRGSYPETGDQALPVPSTIRR